MYTIKLTQPFTLLVAMNNVGD